MFVYIYIYIFTYLHVYTYVYIYTITYMDRGIQLDTNNRQFDATDGDIQIAKWVDRWIQRWMN